MRPDRLGLALGDTAGIYPELATAVGCVARDAGIDVRCVADPVAAREVDVVLAIGYPDYFPWLARSDHDRRVAWLGEALPPARGSTLARVRRELPMGRILDPAIGVFTLGRRRPVPLRLRDWRERASYEHIERVNLAQHRRAARRGIRLIASSIHNAESLARVGIAAPAVPFGYHPSFAGPPGSVDDADRDIDVLVFGTSLSGTGIRRARLTAEIIGDLGPTVRTHVVRASIWGDERQSLLRRARVVLNINQVPGDFMGIRMLVVGAAGAVNVSDPIGTPAPFIPGTHYVEASVGRLPQTIRDLLDDRPRRLEIARTTQRFLVEELTMARSLDALLATLG